MTINFIRLSGDAFLLSGKIPKNILGFVIVTSPEAVEGVTFDDIATGTDPFGSERITLLYGSTEDSPFVPVWIIEENERSEGIKLHFTFGLIPVDN